MAAIELRFCVGGVSGGGSSFAGGSGSISSSSLAPSPLVSGCRRESGSSSGTVALA